MAVEAGQATSLQTLSRGITALEVLAEGDGPVSIGELTERLGLHRSITYRIVRTLEDHGLVSRDAGGNLWLGAGLASLARSVARDLQAAALPELSTVANELGMTALLTVIDQEEAVTLVSVEPRAALAAVAQRPGSRHPLERGAPGRALLRQVRPGDWDQPFETSHDEVIPGLSSVAVPLHLTGQPAAAIAVVYLTGPADVEAIAARLTEAAIAIRREMR